MNIAPKETLDLLCLQVYQAQMNAEQEYRREAGLEHVIELFVSRQDKIAIEIRSEEAPHNEPHLHITHSDKIDVSLSLNDFRILAGTIDRKTLKKLRPALICHQPQLTAIWAALNETCDSLEAHRIISNLDFRF